MKPKVHHSIPEDLFALLSGSLFVAFGLFLFQKMSFLTGGVAGLALILSKVTPLSLSLVFFLLNLPFYWLAFRQMGTRFTVNTFITVSAVSLVTHFLPEFISIDGVNRWFAAVFGGLLIGMGILIMFRHVSSLGGLGILGLFLQEKFGINAGKFQMSVDMCIILVGYFLIPFDVLMLSVLGTLALNLVIAVNHKEGRYQIT